MESGTVIYKAIDKVWWVDLVHQLSTMLLLSCWLQWDRGDNRKGKGEKTWGLKYLISKKKKNNKME